MRRGVVEVIVGVNGFEMDVIGESVTRDGEIQEGEAGVRNSPGEFDSVVEGFGEVDDLFELLAGAQDSTVAVINVVVVEVLPDLLRFTSNFVFVPDLQRPQFF
eukprot:g46612.t1